LHWFPVLQSFSFGLCTLSFQLSNSKSFDPIFTKIYENICWYKMEANFDINQPNPFRQFGVMALEILKKLDFALISGPIFFIWTLHWFPLYHFFQIKNLEFLWFSLLQVLNNLTMRLYTPSISGDFPLISKKNAVE